MSIRTYHQDNSGRDNRESWGEIFGLFIQKGREKTGRSIEEVAALAGMEPSAWLAVESGRVPETAKQLRTMAEALKLSNAQFGIILLLCRDAWEV